MYWNVNNGSFAHHFWKYDEWNHRHHLFCESCRSAAPVTFALCDAVACEQFRRMRPISPANLVEKKRVGPFLVPRDFSSDLT